jgi:hypothetical protein
LLRCDGWNGELFFVVEMYHHIQNLFGLDHKAASKVEWQSGMLDGDVEYLPGR